MLQRVPRGLIHDGFVKIGEEIYPCRVTNMSVTDATIIFEGPLDPPQHFTISLTIDGEVTRTCTTTWHEGYEIGIVFD
jgi:hypothetical protein